MCIYTSALLILSVVLIFKTGDIEIDFNLGARVQCMQSQGHLLVAGLSNGFVHLINLQVSHCTIITNVALIFKRRECSF